MRSESIMIGFGFGFDFFVLYSLDSEYLAVNSIF